MPPPELPLFVPLGGPRADGGGGSERLVRGGGPEELDDIKEIR